MKLPLMAPQEAEGSAWYCTTGSTAFPKHCHDELELNLVTCGEAHYRVAGVEHRVAAHSVIWFFPGTVHELLHVSRDWTMWVFAFRWRLVERSRPLLPRFPNGGDLPVVCSSLAPERVRAISRLGYDLIARRDVEHGNRALAEVLRSAWIAGQDGARPSRPELHPAVERAVKLASDVEFAGTAGALARRCGISATHLSHLFSEQLGVPLVHYRNHWRVQAFIQSFTAGAEEGMLKAALQVGFGSYAQFHRAFHQVTGDGPRRHLPRVGEGLTAWSERSIKA